VLPDASTSGRDQVAEAVLEVDAVTSGYGRAAAIEEVSLRVGRGEIVVLLGANGAGKTTTLRTIAGLNRAWRGSIRFNGVPIEGWRPEKIARSGLALVPEGRQLFPLLSVEENLTLGAFARPDRRHLRDGLEEIYERWPVLAQRRKALASSLSGGQQQMLAVAQALMARPTLLLLDEPSLGLAPNLVQQVFDTVVSLRADGGVTILLVEQMVNRALDIADRAVVLTRGRVTIHGDAADIRADPAVRRAYLGDGSRARGQARTDPI